MWWLITLLVLALVAFYAVKLMKSSTEKQQQEHAHLQQNQLEALNDSEASQSTDAFERAATETFEDAESNGPPPASTIAKGAGVAAVSAALASAETSDQAGSRGSSATSSHSAASMALVQTGDTVSDVREMIKILNLDAPDAGRLDISREELSALRQGKTDGMPDLSRIDDVATRLRKMLA